MADVGVALDEGGGRRPLASGQFGEQIRKRFVEPPPLLGLDYDQEPQTLKEVGANMGVTKERVRQIEARALSKLRAAVIDERIEIPE